MASFAMASSVRIRAVCNSKLWMPVFRGAFTTTAKNAQENAPSVPKFQMSLGYFGALAVSGFSLGILTAAGGPVKGIAYCMNGNGEEPEEWPHADGITICIPRDIERNNRWATINNDIKREAEERIDEYNGRTIRRRGDRIHIDNKDLIHVNGYIHVRIQLNQKRWPSTFAGVNHRPNVPMEHVRDGLRKSLSKKKLYELKEAEQAH